MHHHHVNIAVLFTITFGAGILLIPISFGIGVKIRRRSFPGPALDQWDAARRPLGWKDQSRVWWATLRRRPVGSPALAPAQLALSYYSQDLAKRSPLVTKRWVRRGVPALYAVLAIYWAALAVLLPGMRIFHWVIAAVFACLGVLWMLAVPRSLERQPQRMEHLRAEIQHRHGGLTA